MSENIIFYNIESDGSCTAYGPGVTNGLMLPEPPGNPFHHRYIDGAWVPIPVEELPPTPVRLEDEIAALKAQIEVLTEVINSIIS